MENPRRARIHQPQKAGHYFSIWNLLDEKSHAVGV